MRRIVRVRRTNLHRQEHIDHGDGQVHSTNPPQLRGRVGLDKAGMEDVRGLVLEAIRHHRQAIVSQQD